MERFSDLSREFLILYNRQFQMGVTSLGKQEALYPERDFQVLSLTLHFCQMRRL